MIRKALIAAAAAALIFGTIAVTTGNAEVNKGPEEITLVTTGSAKPKPAFFPHKTHQERYECGTCHHGMADGKQIPYVEGQEIAGCQSCHNPEVLPGKTAGKEKLDTFKGAGHANCQACHKEEAAKDEAKKQLKSCKTCHR
ncbi:MAG: cytochrome c3 family protein [Desulfopila sp.]